MEVKNTSSEDLTEQHKLIDQMGADWPSPIVARKAVSQFSGGIVSPKTLANLDCQGAGPQGGFMVGNQVVYPVESLCQWIKDRITLKRGRKPGQKINSVSLECCGGCKNAKK